MNTLEIVFAVAGGVLSVGAVLRAVGRIGRRLVEVLTVLWTIADRLEEISARDKKQQDQIDNLDNRVRVLEGAR